MKPNWMKGRPVAVSALITSMHSFEDCDRGFSQSTGLPARIQASDRGAWVKSGLATTTAWTLCGRPPRYSTVTWLFPSGRRNLSSPRRALASWRVSRCASAIGSDVRPRDCRIAIRHDVSDAKGVRQPPGARPVRIANDPKLGARKVSCENSGVVRPHDPGADNGNADVHRVTFPIFAGPIAATTGRQGLPPPQ